MPSASNEFCSFYMLKYIMTISDMHLTVNDPRGRFVKTVNIYIAPRPVSDIAGLKSNTFTSWQRCATLTLPRGSSRASDTLAQPVVAAGLKIEYADFYERPGGSKASDGSMLVHCPRCTRGTFLNRWNILHWNACRCFQAKLGEYNAQDTFASYRITAQMIKCQSDDDLFFWKGQD